MPNPRHFTHRSILVAIYLTACSLHAAPDRESFAKEDRPVEGVPVDAFELSKKDLKIEVWAQSPLIYSPVAMDCDARGRLWVTEGIDYNRGSRIAAGQSIIVVEDSDQDGKADSSHVFVTEKVRHAPLGIAVFDNRIVLSATPSIIVYTDVDRNAVFDAKIDKREVFLTGFQNTRHDHSLHAVVGAPSGQWHFSFGNCGADIKTKDGRHFLAGCYYGNNGVIGKPSSDGHVYVGGVAMRINPDGTGLAATSHNMRNPHDMFVTSFGDILQSDNDDPAHCRSSWVMEYANMGYSDLRDGSRSWEEVAKTWEEPAGWSKGRRYSRSHWRENYPGAFPPGTVYGAGSPTGNVFIEDDTTGLNGTYLVCCMVRKEVMSYTPTLVEAQIEMGEHQPFIKLKAGQKGQHFLPTDVVLGTDGSLFLSDFYNNTSRRTNQVSGTIYRITRKDELPKKPSIDFETVPGLLSAIGSPAVNVRSHAAALLVAQGGSAVSAVSARLKKSKGNVYQTARSIWILAQLGEGGQQQAEPFLDNKNPQLQICAYRALRHAHSDGMLGWARRLSASKSPAVRREVAVSLRDVSYDDCKDILKPLFAGYDGKNRYYLEALGTAVKGKEKAAYVDFVADSFGDPKSWTEIPKNLAWRLHTPKAIEALDMCISAQSPGIGEFRHLAMSFASFRNDADREDRKVRLANLGKLPAFSGEDYQMTIQEITAKDLNGLEGEFLNASYPIPTDWGTKSEVSTPAEIAALKGDAEKGRALATNCAACHKIAGNGVSFGPDLTHWGAPRTIEQIANEIVHPDAHLARGYDKPVRVTAGEHVADGLLTNYSWHAGSLKMKVLGGIMKKILFRRSGARVTYLKESWMPSASDMGLSDQNVRDIAEYLKTLNGDDNQVAAGNQPEPVSGTGEGWVELTGKDFVNVNCSTTTWRWKDGHAYCTGKPTGVIRYHEPLTNFELVCEWMHKKKGGNSGVFVWATPQSVRNLAMGKGRLPQGIEVQVLDLGYKEVYEKRHKKPGDWFTSHGDVFPVGPIKMRPFPPVAPNKRRSFPSKETTKGIYEWNHYYVRAVDGEVRLSVNGVEVSGGDQISPAMGFLCLESEGAPIEYRNLRLKKLPPLETKLPEGLEIPIPVIQPGKKPAGPAVSLKGHPIVGTWEYLKSYTREFSPEGFCILRNGADIIWTRKCTAKTKNGLTLEGNLTHVLKGEVLNIENRYKATRKKKTD